MNKKRITLKEAEKFHGHLGPYLVLGILAGEAALKMLSSKKYFGLEVKVWGADKKPKSCLIDGLQLSTGCTYGKGNIQKKNGDKIKILVHNPKNDTRLKISLKQEVIRKLNGLTGHRDSEIFASKLYRAKPLDVFKLVVGSW